MRRAFMFAQKGDTDLGDRTLNAYFELGDIGACRRR
jgi:hypothetical protein